MVPKIQLLKKVTEISRPTTLQISHKVRSNKISLLYWIDFRIITSYKKAVIHTVENVKVWLVVSARVFSHLVTQKVLRSKSYLQSYKIWSTSKGKCKIQKSCYHRCGIHVRVSETWSIAKRWFTLIIFRELAHYLMLVTRGIEEVQMLQANKQNIGITYLDWQITGI